MNQTIFLFGIFLIGQLTGLLLVKRIPLIYILVSGFLLGSIEFVFFALIWIWFRFPYSIMTLWLYISFSFIFLLLWNLKIGTLRILVTRENLRMLIIIWLIFAAVLSFAANKNMSQATADSFEYLMNGRSLSYFGFNHPMSFWLGSFGVFVPMLQSTAVFFEIGYLETLQPVIWFSLLGTFLILIVISIEQRTQQKKLAWAIAILTTLGLASINFIIFQMFYLHTNLIEGLFLLNALSCAWLAMAKNDNKWLMLAMINFLGFNLGRVEAPMVSLIFLLGIIGSNRFSRPTMAIIIGPFLGLSSVWLIAISTVIGSGTRLLTPMRIIVILAGYAGMGILIWGQKYRWVKTVSNHAIKIAFWGAAILLVILSLLRPDNMLESMMNLARNLFISGRWGFTWYVVITLLLLSQKEEQLPFKDIFYYSLPTYFLFILSLSFLRLPYHANWWDSANRMMTHILPATLFYLSLRYAPGIKQNIATQLPSEGS